MEVIHSRFNVMISSGTVYSILYHLEHEGLIKGEPVDRKTVYLLTGTGQEVINCILQSKKEIVEFVETILKS